MATLYTHQGSNVRKTWLLMTIFFVVVIGIGYVAAWLVGNSSILYISIIFALGMNVYSYWYSDTLVLRMVRAVPADPAQHKELINIVENLAITTGLPMPKVYVVQDEAPNAFATGRDPAHAVVAATTGLLHILDRNELEGVMAHEMAHVGNRDMLVMTVAVVLAGFVAMVADLLMHMLWMGGDSDRGKSPVFLILGIVGIILAPFAAQMIQMAISRKREYLADATAALTTRYPEGLASALEKISRSHMPMKSASHATAHLFISDPFGGEERSVWQKIGGLFQTHPPASDRIKILRGMDVA